MRNQLEPRRPDPTALPPFYSTPTLSSDGLVLGAGTVLLSFEQGSSRLVTLDAHGAHDRMVALLAVAARGALAKVSLLQIDAAVDDWRRGDKGLATIRLALAPLPRLRDRGDAHRIALADKALGLGVSPRDLLSELGYLARLGPLLKAYDPDQPRVPAGQGAAGGQWTSGAAGGQGTSSAVGGRTGRAPIRVADAGITPVFLPPEPNDDLDQELRVKERESGLGFNSLVEQLEEGRVSPLRPPVPGIIGPTRTPAEPTSVAPQPGPVSPTAPATGVAPVPLPSPLGPRGGGSSPFSDQDERESGPACPARQKDISRGENAAADLFEYFMSLIVNPDNPTPKHSDMTPDVSSLAYFLPTPTPTGRTSFDDCKETATPPLTSIPDLRPGDMLEYKSPGWSWIIFSGWTKGFDTFAEQVKNQNDAVTLENRGRRVFYCMGDQAAATQAESLYGKSYPSSRFLVCH